jgi:hypothetical protein
MAFESRSLAVSFTALLELRSHAHLPFFLNPPLCPGGPMMVDLGPPLRLARPWRAGPGPFHRASAGAAFYLEKKRGPPGGRAAEPETLRRLRRRSRTA